MEYSNGFLLTDSGRSYLAKCFASGIAPHFTRAVYGDGEQPEGTDLFAVSAMAHEMLDLDLLGYRVVGDGTCEIKAYCDQSKVEDPGFWLREMGLFARDGEDEILYAYAYFGDRPNYVPSGGDARKIDGILKIYVIIGRTSNVEVNISQTYGGFLSKEEFDAHIANESSHPSLPHFGENVETSDIQYMYVDNGDGRVHRSLLPKQLDERYMQDVERDISNIYLTLEALDGTRIYNDANNRVIENFRDMSDVDMMSIGVREVVKGDDSLSVEEPGNLKPGATYVLADGLVSEYVTVKEIAKVGNARRAILEAPVKEHYIYGTGTLYRTTAIVKDGSAAGSQGKQSIQWKPVKEWTGTRGNMESTQIFEVQGTMSGEMTKNAAGEATLAW